MAKVRPESILTVSTLHSLILLAGRFRKRQWQTCRNTRAIFFGVMVDDEAIFGMVYISFDSLRFYSL